MSLREKAYVHAYVRKLWGLCAGGLLGASQIGKALSFDLNYCGFESRASILLWAPSNVLTRRRSEEKIGLMVD